MSNKTFRVYQKLGEIGLNHLMQGMQTCYMHIYM